MTTHQALAEIIGRLGCLLHLGDPIAREHAQRAMQLAVKVFEVIPDDNLDAPPWANWPNPEDICTRMASR